VEEIRRALARDERLARVGRQIALLSRRHFAWTFEITEVGDPNAEALAGGYVLVTTGLLDLVRSDDELAAVIAHEVAHLSHPDDLERAFLCDDMEAEQVSKRLRRDLLARHHRACERRADLASIDYLERSPYSPLAALTVMRRFQRREGPNDHPDDKHPPTSERIAYIKAELRRRGYL
jgi:predicted Zn-dependent protease